jgi:CRISPR-associated protein Cas5t
MLGIHVSTPIACFRKGLAREFLETELLPPPATCYGFLLSLVGETERTKHVGCRIAPVMLNRPEISVVLRTVWRVKNKPLGSSGNTRPDYQQLLSPVELLLWCDSSEEPNPDSGLETRLSHALDRPETIERFGGLSLGESTHLVNEVNVWNEKRQRKIDRKSGRIFLLSAKGHLTLPIWVDHVGSAGTRYATGDLEEASLIPPSLERMSQISP